MVNIEGSPVIYNNEEIFSFAYKKETGLIIL